MPPSSHPFLTMPLRQLSRKGLKASEENVRLWQTLPSSSLQALRERVASTRLQKGVKAVLLFYRLYLGVAAAAGGVAVVYFEQPAAVVRMLIAVLFLGAVAEILRSTVVGPIDKAAQALLPLADKGELCAQMAAQIKASAQARAYRDRTLLVRHELLAIDHAMSEYCAERERDASLQAQRRQNCLDAHTWEPSDQSPPAMPPH